MVAVFLSIRVKILVKYTISQFLKINVNNKVLLFGNISDRVPKWLYDLGYMLFAMDA